MFYLASERLAGRATGTPGRDSAASYIVQRYQQLGVSGAFSSACRDDAPDCVAATYFQRFSIEGLAAQNVVAIIPGTDSARRAEYVVVGAHYDHLGRSPRFANDRHLGPLVRAGADDNASGSAAVLELARRLVGRSLRRSVILVHFDAEELGLVGSRVFVERLASPRASITLMVNLDMVGRLRGQRVSVDVSHAGPAVRALVDSASRAAAVPTTTTSAIEHRSDHASFGAAGIPAIALFTGFHADYHRATDVVSRVDVPGIARVVAVAEQLLRLVDERQIRRGP